MFDTGIYPTGDIKLNKYIQDFFIEMIEIVVLDDLNNCWNEKESPEEYLNSVFPRAFIRRNPQKAVEIIYDLDDIAQSDVVRKNLPPLHLYAMYNIIICYNDIMNDIEFNKHYLGSIQYINNNYTEEVADYYCSLFEDPLEYFIDQYDDQFIWLDLWERRFIWYIDNSEKNPLLTPEAEEMLQLMPNDIINLWNMREKMPESQESMLWNEYDFFISHATEDKKEIAEPLSRELRKTGAKVWLDKFEMSVGSSLRSSIDYGIAHSRHGVIILSKDYMRKFWTEKEMNAFFSKLSLDNRNSKILLPIWHGVTKQEVTQYSPMMADLLALNTEDYTVEELANQLISVL